jgi:hypothetical protein
MQRPIKDVLAGITFIGFGVAFAVGATSYPIGSAARMGPGLYPLLVGGLLAVLGAIIVIKPALEQDGDSGPLTAPAWRGAALALGAIVVFGLTVRGLGLLPAIFLTALLASLASRLTSPLVALAMAIGLTVLSYLIFVVGLQLNLPLLGPWIPRL